MVGKNAARQVTIENGTMCKSEVWKAPAGMDMVAKGQIPRHAVHEKVLQGQIGVGTFVRIQDRKAAAVPVIDCR